MQIGDLALSADVHTGKLSYRPVTELFIHHVTLIEKVTYAEGQTVETTWNHPFWVQNKGWTEVRYLHPGERSVTARSILKGRNPELQMVSFSGTAQPGYDDPSLVTWDDVKEGTLGIAKVEEIHRTASVYNIEVEGNHDYFVTASGVLVHNYQNTPLKTPGSYSKPGIADSISQSFKNWWNTPGLFNGFHTDETIIKTEEQKHGLVAGYQTTAALGYALDDKGENTITKYNAFQDMKSTILSNCGCLDPVTGIVNKSRMSEVDRSNYEYAVDGQIRIEYDHSLKEYQSWTRDKMADVPLTPYSKMIIQAYALPDVPMERLDDLTIRTADADYRKNYDTRTGATYNAQNDEVRGFLRIADGRPGGLCQFCVQDLSVLAHELTHMEQADQLGIGAFIHRHEMEDKYEKRTLADFPGNGKNYYGGNAIGKDDTLEDYAYQNQLYVRNILWQKADSGALILKK